MNPADVDLMTKRMSPRQKLEWMRRRRSHLVANAKALPPWFVHEIRRLEAMVDQELRDGPYQSLLDEHIIPLSTGGVDPFWRVVIVGLIVLVTLAWMGWS